MTKTCR